MPGKRVRAELKSARAFVEFRFGIGLAASKITFNPRSTAKALTLPEKKRFGTVSTSKIQEEIDWLRQQTAVATRISKDGRKRLIYLSRKGAFNSKKDEIDAISRRAVHEYAHSVVGRLRSLKRSKASSIAEEIIANNMEFEWTSKKQEEVHLKRINADLDYNDFNTPSAIGFFIATQMHKKMTENERQKAMNELLNLDLRTKEDAFKWLDRRTNGLKARLAEIFRKSKLHLFRSP
jgi:hypothetical protein